MSLFIQFFIIISLHFRVASRWNYSFHSNFRSKFNYTSTVIALIWYQVFHFKILNQFLCTRAIVHVSVGYEYFQWHAPSCLVPFWDRHALISISCTTCVRTTFRVCRINHNTAQIWLVHHWFQYFVPNTIVAPPCKSPMRIFSITILLWQIPPRCTSQHAAILKIQNTAIVKQRLSTPFLPVCPTLPGRFTSIFSQISSFISCLCNIVIFTSGIFNTTLSLFFCTFDYSV